ncbi:hypothetical protein FPRO05_03234 [Fusarium proliferatum]|uniref:Extracellular membrane protein CFEM domain-containing protein n=1 Tax=Gibberella intermedia TaxID=948311 RepID=A0A365N174_GIBIN|nr:hypothetical protein FPRO05_03234 [Fusarium proliferatum]
MKLLTLISALATASLVSADQRSQLEHPNWRANKLSVRGNTCPRPMCQTPPSQGPNDAPACGDSYAACKFDQFPCDDHMTPKVTDTHHCYCIFADNRAMTAWCQERGFKSGNNPWIYHYAVQCYGATSDKVCNDFCQFQDLGNGRINKANPNGPCACDKPWPSADFC